MEINADLVLLAGFRHKQPLLLTYRN